MTQLPDRHDGWMALAITAAPRAPMALLDTLCAALADPRQTTDSLLLLADALDQAAYASLLAGRPVQQQELGALADLPRRLAPELADGRDRAMQSRRIDLPPLPAIQAPPRLLDRLRPFWPIALGGKPTGKPV